MIFVLSLVVLVSTCSCSVSMAQYQDRAVYKDEEQQSSRINFKVPNNDLPYPRSLA